MIEARKGVHDATDEYVKTYSGGVVLILDDTDDDDDGQSRNREYHLHQANNNSIRAFFSTSTNYSIQSIKVPQAFRRSMFLRSIRARLLQIPRDQLVILYYHGKASSRGDRYQWHMCGRTRPATINAWSLFEMVNATSRDCLFLLDCPIATRFNTWNSRPPRRQHGHTEYIFAGQSVLDENGRDLHENGFTQQCTRYLESWKKAVIRRSTTPTAYRSIPQVLSRNRELFSNPIRIWTDKTSHNGTNVVERLAFDPADVRMSGLLHLVLVRIQGVPFHDDSDASDEDQDVVKDDIGDDDEEDEEDEHDVEQLHVRENDEDDEHDDNRLGSLAMEGVVEAEIGPGTIDHEQVIIRVEDQAHPPGYADVKGEPHPRDLFRQADAQGAHQPHLHKQGGPEGEDQYHPVAVEMINTSGTDAQHSTSESGITEYTEFRGIRRWQQEISLVDQEHIVIKDEIKEEPTTQLIDQNNNDELLFLYETIDLTSLKHIKEEMDIDLTSYIPNEDKALDDGSLMRGTKANPLFVD